MIILLSILCGIIWFSLGVWSFIYWWTKDFDFTCDALCIITAIQCGILGPLSNIPLFFAMSPYREPKILFKKKED